MKVFIKTLTGNTIALEVSGDDTVECLKWKIEQEINMRSDKQRIIFKGKQLEEGRTLAEYGIENESTTHLLARLRGQGHCFMSADHLFPVWLDCVTKQPFTWKPDDADLMRFYFKDDIGPLQPTRNGLPDRPFVRSTFTKYWYVTFRNVLFESEDRQWPHPFPHLDVHVPLIQCTTPDIIGFVLDTMAAFFKLKSRPALFMQPEMTGARRVSVTTNRDLVMIPVKGVRFVAVGRRDDAPADLPPAAAAAADDVPPFLRELCERFVHTNTNSSGRHLAHRAHRTEDSHHHGALPAAAGDRVSDRDEARVDANSGGCVDAVNLARALHRMGISELEDIVDPENKDAILEGLEAAGVALRIQQQRFLRYARKYQPSVQVS